MGAHETEVYYLYNVGEMLGISKREMERIVEKNFENFPFSVLKIHKGDKPHYVVPKKQVDDYLKKGKKPQVSKFNKGRPAKWHKEEYVTWQYNIPNELNERFDAVILNINKENLRKYGTVMYKGDFIRLAVEEFIQRRPEYLTCEKEGE